MSPGKIDRRDAREMVNVAGLDFSQQPTNRISIADVCFVIFYPRFLASWFAGREDKNLIILILCMEESDQVCSDESCPARYENTQTFTMVSIQPVRWERPIVGNRFQ